MSRPITDVLRDITNGAFVTEINDAMNEAVGAVRATGKKAEIIIKLTLKKAKGHETVINVDHALKASIPEFERPTTSFFATMHNDLVMENPEQRKLELRSVQRAPAESPTRETVDPDTGEIRSVALPAVGEVRAVATAAH